MDPRFAFRLPIPRRSRATTENAAEAAAFN